MTASKRERPRSRHWLSVGFSDLAVRVASKADEREIDFDVLIVGSGYGGSIAAHHLAGLQHEGRPLSVGILERGREYVEGDFPAETGDLPPFTRFSHSASKAADGVLDGLFDFRFGPDVSALIGSGVGGGSLINAGVMIRPLPTIFNLGWPTALRGGELDSVLEECEALLGAAPLEQLPPKFHALNRFSGHRATPASVTIATTADDRFNACNYCGNCATGCNFGAKRSLDVQLLADALARNERVEIFTGAAVERIAQGDDHWIAYTSHTNAGLKARYPGVRAVRAKRLLLAAGTFGSTEILMKSDVSVSSTLGQRFSTNGDMLAVSYNQDSRVHAAADGAGPRTAESGAGPTITGVFDDRDTSGFLLEEMNVPWPIRVVFEEVFTTSAVLSELGTTTLETHWSGPVENDPYSVSDLAIERTSVWALMGLDSAEGELVFPGQFAGPSSESPGAGGEGVLGVRWESFSGDPLFARQMDFLEELAADANDSGKIIPNPAWQPLPTSMKWLAGDSGPLFTVHPLGGCAMADSGEEGVVDDLGQVFIGDSERTHNGLVVLDGSIIPTSLGANPALTISAVALRAIRTLAENWGYRQADDTGPLDVQALPPRPRYRDVVDAPLQPTKIQLRERMVGPVSISGFGECIAELTLVSGPTRVTTLSRESDKNIALLPESRVRVFKRQQYEDLMASDPVESLEAQLDEIAIASAQIEGSLQVFPRAFSVGLLRTLRALGAWALNRGLRDSWQGVEEKLRGESAQSFMELFSQLAPLASHAGERRLISYALTVVSADGDKLFQRGQQISGDKLITYRRASNPLKQLMELSLTRFPKMRGSSTLTLDTRYLARIGVPLINIVGQKDTPAAITDFVGLGGYLLRMLFGIHAWTLRKPDTISAAPMRRLPGRLPGIAEFEQYPIPNPADSKRPLPAVLTRYRRPGARPVVMIHGYSASGTTFAHECLEPSAAEYLWREGRDVWVLDLRTSPGVPTAILPWTFEDVADGDIPQAIDHIWRETGEQPIDVIAHCMGAAMLSMTILAEDSDDHPLRRAARERIGRIVLTQVGPGVVFSPANVFRAYAMTYLKHFLELSRFDFRVNTDHFSTGGGLADTLLDRLLNVLPYPDEEFMLENPWQPWRRTEFVSIRHRMDLLYGRDFSLANVTDGFLENIDAMFGPLNLDTVSQAMLFTRWKNVTDKEGRNRYYLRQRIHEHWTFPTLSIHGKDNGLSSPETLARNRQVLRDGGVDYETALLPGFGHQDIWVSERSEHEVFPRITSFLDRDRQPRPRSMKLRPLVGRPPYLGPVLSGIEPGGELTIRLGTSPNLGRPELIVLVELNADLKPVFPLAYDSLQSFDMDGNGMIRLMIPAGPPRLLLTLYDEHPALLDATFGEAIEMPPSDLEYDEGDEARVTDAIERVLKLPATLLETGVLETPRRASDDEVTIAFGSCQFPAGLLDGEIAFDAWKRLLARVSDGHAPDALLLLGDQVYVDPTGGLFDPARLADRYRIPYERWLSADPVQRVLGRIPTFMMLDDHELKNDWEPMQTAGDDRALAAGERAFRSYQFDGARRRNAEKFWGEPEGAPLPVFMMNSRTDRLERHEGEQASMFSEEQLACCESWLANLPADSPKIITSASLPLPRHYARVGGVQRASTLDGWDGYPASTNRLLAFIARERIANVVFLSGDEHLPIAATATLWHNDTFAAKVVSLHTSALYAPIPFANARPEDFVLQDAFDVESSVRCEVSATTYPPDFGFSYVTFRRKDSGGWMLRVRFDGSNTELDLLLD